MRKSEGPLEFDKLLEGTRSQNNRTTVPVRERSARQLYNLLQTESWIPIIRASDAKGQAEASGCIICDTREPNLFKTSRLCGAITQADALSLLSNRTLIDCPASVILYSATGAQDEDLLSVLTQLETSFSRHIREVYILRVPFLTFLEAYEFTGLFVGSGIRNCLLGAVLNDIPLPTEILTTGRLFWAHRDVLRLLTSPIIHQIGIDYLVDISFTSIIPDCAASSNTSTTKEPTLPRYLHIPPDPTFRTESRNPAALELVTATAPQLVKATEALYARLQAHPNSKTLVVAKDKTSLSGAVILAFLMDSKQWSESFALGFLMAQSADIHWPAPQLKAVTECLALRRQALRVERVV